MCCSPGSPCFEWINALGPSFVALVIGVIAARIAWTQKEVARSQKEVAQAKLKLDLFERRYKIFHRTWEILSAVVRDGTQEKRGRYGLATPFNNFLPEAAFLFGKEIEIYLNELVKHWTELGGLEAEKDDSADRVKNIARTTDLKNYFFEQASTGAKAEFGKYLDFANWK
jgi:hypothetical protein